MPGEVRSRQGTIADRVSPLRRTPQPHGLAIPFPRPPSPADLSRRLKKLDRVFSIEKIRAEGMGASEVISYYEECSPAYRKHHSREGSMHLAISPGRFRAEGFYGSSTGSRRPGRPSRRTTVLELGFGQGFNLAYLAPSFPRCASAAST